MAATRDDKRFEKYLLALTDLPTAAGQEQRVIQWVRDWAKGRKSATLRRDRFGNLMLSRATKQSGRALIFAAHMDHPAFVVRQVKGDVVEAAFLGGVADAYFKGASICLRGGEHDGLRGKVEGFTKGGGGVMDKRDKQVRIRFPQEVKAKVGQVITWDLKKASIKKGKLHAPACDDLAAVAAAISAFEKLSRTRGGRDVRVLLTRCEEVGFVGAMGACRSGLIPKTAQVVALENSKEMPGGPGENSGGNPGGSGASGGMGGGPIVRVGDRTSTFDPELTREVALTAESLSSKDKAFIWQRALMIGGTCEATAYQALGFQATCVCLALGNYHNQGTDKKGNPSKVKREVISVADYHGLIRLLVAMGKGGGPADNLQPRLESLFKSRKALLAGK